MKVIWKYKVYSRKGIPVSTIQVPRGARFVDFREVDYEGFVWAIVDEDNPLINYEVFIYYTGEAIEDENVEYVGSLTDNHGYVLHCFVR